VKPFVVEFLGTQGSGKTTLLPTVVSFLKDNGIQAYTPTEAARPFARRTSAGRLVERLAPPSIRPSLLWQVYYRTSMLMRRSFDRKNRELVRFVKTTQHARPTEAGVRERRILFWFEHLCGTYTFLSTYAREKEALVYDDGFVHRAVHLHASPVETPAREHILTYLNHIPLPNVLIIPRVPLAVCVERVTARGVWGHFRDKTQGELHRYLANSETVVNLVVDELRIRNCAIIEVDNNHTDVQKSAADLRQQLQTIQPAPSLS
jgi:thymidylate kinase